MGGAREERECAGGVNTVWVRGEGGEVKIAGLFRSFTLACFAARSSLSATRAHSASPSTSPPRFNYKGRKHEGNLRASSIVLLVSEMD